MSPEITALILLALRIYENSTSPVLDGEGNILAENIRAYKSLADADQVFFKHFGMSKEDVDAKLKEAGITS